ncbi:hypothetical protein EDD16DRAFT_484598 [Pisolithus croceorrhizus]|nr:hypothetical protein EDD16DRAFT_484598 [Pisolithus croceorrhizus]
MHVDKHSRRRTRRHSPVFRVRTSLSLLRRAMLLMVAPRRSMPPSVTEVGVFHIQGKGAQLVRLLVENQEQHSPVRRTALRQITDRTPAFDAGLLFDKILPLLMERTLEDRELLPFLKAVCRNKKLW